MNKRVRRGWGILTDGADSDLIGAFIRYWQHWWRLGELGGMCYLLAWLLL